MRLPPLACLNERELCADREICPHMVLFLRQCGARKSKGRKPGMGIGEIVLIGLGLSMDAVAVSASNAMCFPRERLRLLEMAAWFAVFQGAMPLAGFLAAGAASDLVTRMGGWLALLILGWVG